MMMGDLGNQSDAKPQKLAGYKKRYEEPWRALTEEESMGQSAVLELLGNTLIWQPINYSSLGWSQSYLWELLCQCTFYRPDAHYLRPENSNEALKAYLFIWKMAFTLVCLYHTCGQTNIANNKHRHVLEDIMCCRENETKR